MSKPYVTHTCKNRKCERAFNAVDDNNAQSYPPQTKYCLDCQLEGFTNVVDPERRARGLELAKRAAEARAAKKAKYSCLEDL